MGYLNRYQLSQQLERAAAMRAARSTDDSYTTWRTTLLFQLR
jgi:hypothetical protein